MRMAMIERRLLVPAKKNVRTDLGDLEELTDSLQAAGQVMPFIVKPIPGRDEKYEVVDGNRRLAAFAGTSLTRVWCLVRESSNERTDVATMLVTAMNRELPALDQARGFQRLIETGMSAADIARTTGYSSSKVSSRLALLRLPPEAQTMVASGAMTATDAVRLSRGLAKRKRDGGGASQLSAPLQAGGAKPAWFTSQHRLAAAAAARCTHKDDRVLVGRTACGQCWEDAIVQDAHRSSRARQPV